MLRKGKTLGLLAVLALVVPGLVACQRGGQQEGATGEAVETDEVALKGNSFQPSEIKVKVGSTVTWTNQDEVTHTVTSQEEGLFDSGDLTQDDTFQFTFEEPGTYEYYCRYHQGMEGQVIVEE